MARRQKTPGVQEHEDGSITIFAASTETREGIRRKDIPPAFVEVLKGYWGVGRSWEMEDFPTEEKTGLELADELVAEQVTIALEEYGQDHDTVFNAVARQLGEKCGIPRRHQDRNTLCGIVNDEITRQLRSSV